MKIILIIILCFFPLSAWASPFLVCDPQVGVETYEVEYFLPNSTPVLQGGIPAQPDGSLKLDLAPLTQPGKYTFRVAACITGWGCSDWSDPFSATKPGTPGNVKIIR